MTSIESLETLISDKVSQHQGVKLTYLISEVASEIYTTDGKNYHPDLDLVVVINNMIKKGELVEIEYVMPQMEYRVKSFILPKGTKVTLSDLS